MPETRIRKGSNCLFLSLPLLRTKCSLAVLEIREIGFSIGSIHFVGVKYFGEKRSRGHDVANKYFDVF